jgi:multidrug resistance efflux pump
MAATFAALIAIVYRGIHFWNYFQSYESNNDAQIDAPVSPISSRITGTITRVYIEDYQRVKPGQLLVKLDPREHQVAVELNSLKLRRRSIQDDRNTLWYSPRSVRRRHVTLRRGVLSSATQHCCGSV